MIPNGGKEIPYSLQIFNNEEIGLFDIKYYISTSSSQK
jgi:hypothetical protein